MPGDGDNAEAAPTLYSSWFCPFAQRAWIAIEEKKIKYNFVEVDPYNKTDDWLNISPRGLVPAIRHKDKSIYESGICIEYIDEAFHNGVHLLPEDPYDRARERIWGDFVSKKLVQPYYAALMKETNEERKKAKEELLSALAEFNGEISDEGPYFQGNQLGYVDIMLMPFAYRYLAILNHYRGFEIPKDKRYAKYEKWYRAVLSHHSIKHTMPDDLDQRLLNRYNDRYKVEKI